MQGNWVGEGERVQLASGKRTRIETQTQAQVAEGRLTSANQILESGESGRREYTRRYWVRPAAVAGHYELGAGQEISSRGELAGDLFTAVQAVANWRVRTETRFLGRDESELNETFADERGPIARTRIHYRRQP
jgi:hypothetical protein